MAMRFCKKCKGLMIPFKNFEKGISQLKCSSCEYIEEEDFSKIIGANEKFLPAIKKGEGIASNKNEFADYKNICKKCGHNMAQVLDLGIFYSDEDNLYLLKCGKCGFSEKIGRKTS